METKLTIIFKPLYLFTACLLHFANGISQSPAIEWQNTMGGSYSDFLTDIVITPDNGFILSGTSFSFMSSDKSEMNMGPKDFWIIKINEFGEIVWDNTIGGDVNDECESIIATADGNFMLGGHSTSEISYDKTEACQGDFDYWLVKLDGSGNLLWQNTIGGNESDRIDCLINTSDNGYLIAGHSISGVSGDKTEGNIGLDDYWIIKLNNTGDIEWQNTIGGNNIDIPRSATQTEDGGYLIGGYSKSGVSADKTEANLGLNDYWVVKLNAAGIIEWQNTIGGSGDDLLESVVLMDDGGYLLGGTSGSGISGDKTEINMGSTDYWIIKLNDSGTIVWQTTIGGTNSDDLFDLEKTPEGDYLIAGESDSEISGDKTIGKYGIFLGNSDYWVMKIDDAGNIIWQGGYGGFRSDSPKTIIQLPDGYIVGGNSTSDAGGDKTEDCLISNDMWVLKLTSTLHDVCPVTSNLFAENIQPTHARLNWDDVIQAESFRLYYRPVGAGAWTKKTTTSTRKTLNGLTPATTYEYTVKCSCDGVYTDFSAVETFTTLPLKEGISKDQLSINIYPNPVTDKITININHEFTDGSITITDISGKKIIQQELKSGISEFEISKLMSGLYFINFNIDGITSTQKFIKQ